MKIPNRPEVYSRLRQLILCAEHAQRHAGKHDAELLLLELVSAEDQIREIRDLINQPNGDGAPINVFSERT